MEDINLFTNSYCSDRNTTINVGRSIQRVKHNTVPAQFELTLIKLRFPIKCMIINNDTFQQYESKKTYFPRFGSSTNVASSSSSETRIHCQQVYKLKRHKHWFMLYNIWKTKVWGSIQFGRCWPMPWRKLHLREHLVSSAPHPSQKRDEIKSIRVIMTKNRSFHCFTVKSSVIKICIDLPAHSSPLPAQWAWPNQPAITNLHNRLQKW